MKRRRSLSQRLTDMLVKLLVKEHRGYNQRFPYDPSKLRDALKPGDVVLVEGSQRISEVIKYLTQSSWSHAALYVGSALVKIGDHRAEDLRERYGIEAEALLIEASVEDGVTAVPLSKYVNHNIRICRPINLRPGDLTTVLDTVISQLGNPYNRDHIRSLLWYFLPIELLPKRWRRRALERSGRLSKDVICSTQIAQAFQKVRYPILPRITEVDGTELPTSWLPGWLPLRGRRARNSILELGVFTPCDPTLVTPRDFDLSPYFDIVKLAAHAKREFDYKKIHWADAEYGHSRGASGRRGAESVADPATPSAARKAS